MAHLRDIFINPLNIFKNLNCCLVAAEWCSSCLIRDRESYFLYQPIDKIISVIIALDESLTFWEIKKLRCRKIEPVVPILFEVSNNGNLSQVRIQFDNPGDTEFEQFLNEFNRNEDYDIDFLIRNKL